MKHPVRSLFFTLFLFFLPGLVSNSLSAQSPADHFSTKNDLLRLKRQMMYENAKLKQQIDSLDQKLENLNASISASTASISTTQQNLEAVKKESNEKVSSLDQLLGNTTRKWMLGILAIVAVFGLVFWWFKQRIQKGESNAQAQIASTAKTIAETQKYLSEETVRLDTKLSDILESQLKLEQEKETAAPEKYNEDVDHSLAMKVADEILRINKNLSNMDASTKGLKQLAASIKRIEDNFASNGYTLPELLGKSFSPGMKLIVANSIPDDNLSAGEEIITRIIKPQVNFKGVMIQAAQVEVSVGQ